MIKEGNKRIQITFNPNQFKELCLLTDYYGMSFTDFVNFVIHHTLIDVAHFCLEHDPDQYPSKQFLDKFYKYLETVHHIKP